MSVVLAAVLWCCAFFVWRDSDAAVAAYVFAAFAALATMLAWRVVRAGLHRDDEPGPPPPSGLL
jgi:hypothetical protein